MCLNNSLGRRQRWVLRTLTWLLLIGVLPAALAQSETFHKLESNVIEARLGRFSRSNQKRYESVRTLFEEVGCAGNRLTTQQVRNIRQPNVLCTLPGQSDSVIVVGAHFDMVENGQGVVDNWSGAALLSSLYESLAEMPLRHRFVFVAFSAEEKGLLGSHFYVTQLGSQERAQIKAMVNLDSLGLSSTKVWESHAHQRLLELLRRTAQESGLPLQGMDVDELGSSDSESFREARIPAVTIHSVTVETLSILHTPQDKPEAIQFTDYYQTYQLVAAFLVLLDSNLEGLNQ